ncbi:hypothetical protein OH77DRAFT_1575323 [Trametes cingulata]|nr:hypothetical protein OH77DRAFT_1575323 [Trametes cingulata]
MDNMSGEVQLSSSGEASARRLIIPPSSAATASLRRAMMFVTFAGQAVVGMNDDQSTPLPTGEAVDTSGDPLGCAVEVWLVCLPQDDQQAVQPLPMRICLPSTLQRVRATTPAVWNDLFDHIAAQYGGSLRRSQWDAIAALCYIYRWFANIGDDEEAEAAWAELGGVLEGSVVMSVMTGASGQTALRNVALWARNRIPGAYPDGISIWGMAEPPSGEGGCPRDSVEDYDSEAGDFDFDSDDSE